MTTAMVMRLSETKERENRLPSTACVPPQRDGSVSFRPVTRLCLNQLLATGCKTRETFPNCRKKRDNEKLFEQRTMEIENKKMAIKKKEF